MSGSTEFVKLAEPVLAFRRVADGQTLTCIFNLSPKAVGLSVSANAKITGPSQAATYTDGALKLGANGFAYLESINGRPSIEMVS